MNPTRRTSGWALLTGAWLLAGNIHAGEAPLTLAEAQRRATEQSRQLLAQDAAITASREMAVASGQLPDPVLKFALDNLPVEGQDQFSVARDFMTMRRIGVMQEFTRPEKRQLRPERFEREAERGTAEKTAALADIRRDAALAWLDRYYAEAMTAAVAEQIKESRLEIEAAEGAYRGGRGNQAEVFIARSALVALQDRASELNRRARIAIAALARWIGDGADAPLAGPPAIDAIHVDSRSLEAQLARHPQVLVLAKQEEMAATEARLAQANRSTDWSVEASFSQRGNSYSNMVSLEVSIPLPWDRKNRQDRERASKLAMVEQAKAQREEILRARVAEARTMIHEWENSRERRERYQRELVPLARERTQASLATYRGGKADLSTVLSARRNELEVTLQALQLELEAARWWAQLNFLLPNDATGRVGAPEPSQPAPPARVETPTEDPGTLPLRLSTDIGEPVAPESRGQEANQFAGSATPNQGYLREAALPLRTHTELR